jgi:phosphomevalonate kinase
MQVLDGFDGNIHMAGFFFLVGTIYDFIVGSLLHDKVAAINLKVFEGFSPVKVMETDNDEYIQFSGFLHGFDW